MNLIPPTPLYREKSLPNTPPATLLANPPPYMALDAIFDAWLNLSQRENASVFVMVRTRAMAIETAVSVCRYESPVRS